MNKKLAIFSLFILTFGLSSFAAGQTRGLDRPTGEPVQQLKQYQQEVKQLRLELVQQSIEFQEWKIQQLQDALQQVKQEQGRLAEQASGLHQRLVDLQQITEAAEGDETTGRKDDLNNKQLRTLAELQQPVTQRETELQQRLGQEQKRLEELQLKAAKLKPTE